MSTATAEPEYRLLHGQTWQDYEQALAERDRHGRRYRITFDRGVLEIMPTSSPHERWKKLIDFLLTAYCEETGIPLLSFGNLTCSREDLDRGLEPDECYYIRHEPRVRGREALDLTRDPPPDLAVEVEYSRSVVDRLGIYAALGVSEVWRYDGTALAVLALGPDGTYVPVGQSQLLPALPLVEVTRRIATGRTMDQLTWMRDWRAWVRANAAAGGTTAAPPQP